MFSSRHPNWCALIAIVISAPALVAAVETNAPAFTPKLPDDSRYLAGRYVYQRNCIICHGPTGDGAGPMAGPLVPKPRSFRSGIFKYRSTPAGALPTDEDLTRTIRQGVPGTSMPLFDKLSASEIGAVIEYIKFFSSRWKDRGNYAPPLKLPEMPEWFRTGETLARRAAKGGELFQMACATCHGVNGDGFGAVAAALVDDWGEPIKSADLRQRALRVGPDPVDAYRVLLTGISGTPMPSFADATTDEQRWELVAFIEQLKRDGRR